MSTITFAHRGGMGDRPENSMIGFHDALARGATGLESDVRLSADGEAVLVHDKAVWTRGRRRTVAKTAASTLQSAGVVTLVGLYGEIGWEYELSLDLKDHDAAQTCIEAASRHGDGALRRLWLVDTTLDRVTAIRALSPEVRVVLSTRFAKIESDLERTASNLATHGIDAINLPASEWNKGIVAMFHRFGILAFGWDAQEERQIRRALSIGLDGIYSDWVDRLVGVTAEWTETD
ncbi:MAG: glycerophosphodiester phosphodiesterase [Actinobacteria bacterium]|nr:glycerophosphodiester phosphodiesterase [Actinomycetota bacterium]MCB9388743.1 glycerophosphodiester phosphodiesterase [Acidimicrobiia bacterium]